MDLSSYSGREFITPADDDGYVYMFRMCEEIPQSNLPEGCKRIPDNPDDTPYPAVVKVKDDNPLDCELVGSYGPCDGFECGMTYQPAKEGVPFAVTWRYQYGCENTFRVFLAPGSQDRPHEPPYNDPNDPYECYWTTTWQSLDAYHSVTGSSETDIEAELELPTGVDATIALLFCYVCWMIFAGMMIVYACGIPERNKHSTGVEESRPASQRCPAVERALCFHQLPCWHRRLVTFQWATCGNVLFIVASLVYVVASVVNFQLAYYDVAWVGDYYFYDKINLSGALIFTIEPLIDVAGAIASTWFTTIDQAHWETFGRKQPFRSDEEPNSHTAPTSEENSSEHTASNPLSASSAEDSSAGAVTAVDRDPWVLRAPTSSQPWWQRWQWQGYVVWEKAPTTSELVLQDLNLYAALFFFLASLGYLWAAALPWMYALQHTLNTVLQRFSDPTYFCVPFHILGVTTIMSTLTSSKIQSLGM
jgi:hypothetical protein